MAIKKRTDQLPAILSGDVDNNDLMYLVHENAQAETGYDSKKIFVSDVGRKLNNGVEYATELPSFPPGDQNPLDALEYLNSKINDLYPVDSASGSLVNFTTSLALPLVALKTNIVAQGSGGTPSSPVPITGFSSVILTRAGKNLVLGVIEGGSIGSNGTIAGGSTQYDMVYAPIKAGVTYTISTNETTNQFVGGYFTSLPSVGSTSYDGQRVVQYSKTFTAPITGYVVFRQMSGYEYAQLEIGSTATDYVAPVTPTIFTLPLGQTIYGGYVDWKNGKLVVTHLVIPFNSQDLTWVYQDANTRFYTASLANVIKKASTATVMPEGFNCECYNPHAYSGLADLDIAIAVSGNIFVKDTNYTDVTVWLNAIGNQKFVYPLAVPIETDITIPDITALVGEQNIWANTGNIDVSFQMGVQEYIDKKIAEVQALIL